MIDAQVDLNEKLKSGLADLDAALSLIRNDSSFHPCFKSALEKDLKNLANLADEIQMQCLANRK